LAAASGSQVSSNPRTAFAVPLRSSHRSSLLALRLMPPSALGPHTHRTLLGLDSVLSDT